MKTEDLYLYKAKVKSNYDGDTITVDVDLGFKTYIEQKLRMARIDTPELRGAEKARGQMVRDYVRELIQGKEVYIRTEKDTTGKYGRYIADLYYEDAGEWINLNDHLLAIGFAEPYN